MNSPRKRRVPYVIGRPIDEPKLFFGRESLFGFIEDHLKNNEQVILLHGQRRIGKSSVLRHIPNKVKLGDEFVFVLSDFQDKGQCSLREVVHGLAKDIVEKLTVEKFIDNPDVIDLTFLDDLEQDLEQDGVKFREFLEQVYEKLGDKKLVLLLDEFDVLDGKNSKSEFEDFFRYLKSIIYYEKRLFIIPVVGRRLDDMPKLQNNLFRGKPQQRIGLLEELSAQRLITNPLEEFLKNHKEVSLKYNEAAIKEIIKLSAGHPYFTQGICYGLFVEARDQEKTEILPEDVNQVIDRTIELLEPGLIPFRNGLPILERIVFSAAATAQERAKQKNQSLLQNPLELLKEFGVDVEHGNLHQASKNLIENKFLDEDGYKVTIKFVRHWLLKYHPIQSSIWEFEKLDPHASDYYKKANIWRNKRQTDDELYHYQKALELNPNHFSALFSLAELYLNKAELHLERTKSYPNKNKDELDLIRKDFLQALKLYERAYKVDSERAQDEYIKSLMGAIKLYLEDHNFSEASKLYRRFLEVNPERIEDEYINLSVDLAKSHLKDKKFKEALDFYELAYNVNPERVKDGYIKLLLEATKLHLEEHKFQEASELYERSREVNPENAEDEYINLLVGLANSHLKNQEFEEELKLYELAYKVNSESVKAEYTESLVRYGDYLIKNRDLTNRDTIAEIRIFPEKILDIDSTNRKAKLQLTLLDRKEDNLREQEENREINSQIELYKKRGKIINLSAILISFMLIVISFFLGLKFRPAPSFQPEPELSDNEKKKRFSRGEGTIFDENNQDIFKCNQKFQKKKYSEAAECFGKLVKNDSDEPEALIYYNNSLSRQSTNRQVLAVIVPADRDEKSKEMLRGVAQAQHKFNSNESFSTKPLEILIVDNSSNDPETSLKVAREIVKDKSILGVVGNTNKKALEVYEAESLAMISPTSTNTELSEILFITIDNERLSEKLAKYVEELDVEKVIIFYDSKSLSSERIKKDFKYYLNLNSNSSKLIEEVDLADLKEESLDLVVESAIEQKIKVAILFPDSETVDSVIKIAKKNHQQPEDQQLKLLGSHDLYYCNVLKQGEQAVKGLILAVPWFKGMPEAENFSTEVKNRWGGEVSWLTAASYDATQAFISALSNSGENPSRDTVLQKVKDVNLQADQTSGESLSFSSGEKRKGKAILVEVVESSSNPDCSDLDFSEVEEQ